MKSHQWVKKRSVHRAMDLQTISSRGSRCSGIFSVWRLFAHVHWILWFGCVLVSGLFTTLSVYASPVRRYAVTDVLPPSHGTSIAHDAAPRQLASAIKLRKNRAEMHAAIARFDMPKALSIARDCRDLALSLRKTQRARHCDQLMFAVAQRLGDARSMIESDYWWKQHGFPPGANKNSRVFSDFHNTNLGRLVKTVPAFSAKVTGHITVLKYVHPIEVIAGHDGYIVPVEPIPWLRPTVTATINGEPVAVLVDTGTSVPLVMDQAHAAALGATPLLSALVAPHVPKTTRVPFTGFPIDLIASFKFGGLVMHNVATLVIKDGSLHVGVLVGLPVLARFGRVNLNDTQITAGSAEPHCTPGTPLEFVGGGQLGFSTTANGRSAIAMIDTGNAYALIVGSKLTPGSPLVKTKTTMSKPHEVPKTYLRQLQVQVGSWPLTGLDVPVANRDRPSGVGVNIGAPLLGLADVQINFSKPSLRVTPKPAVKKGAVIMVQNRGEEPAAESAIVTLLRVMGRVLTRMSSSADNQGR